MAIVLGSIGLKRTSLKEESIALIVDFHQRLQSGVRNEPRA